MNKCKERVNPEVCEYCIYHKKDKGCVYEDMDSNMVFYNNIPYDNTSKKLCPICKKVYTDYPSTSRKDNKTLICSDCGIKEIQEPFEELLYEYGIEVVDKTDE